ncbi:MAG: TRAP transporter large permease [Desulfarculaceae bacterium]|jgi:tripartite ATP-independent transporter DctM subunit
MTELLLLVVLTILMLLAGFPLFVCFGVGGLAMMLVLEMDPGFAVPAIYTNLNSFVLMAIPFFIFAGGLMTAAGISARIVEFANAVVGRFKGGLGVVTIVSSALFGAISGSSASAVATIGMTILPQMEKYGYTRQYATALVACSGLLGQLIPPSIPMILFGMVTKTSVAGCFLAAAGPGILIVLAYSIINYLRCRRSKDIRVMEHMSGFKHVQQIGLAARRSALALVMPVIVLGGIYGGFFTPTEAGCVAVVYALCVGAATRRLTPKAFRLAAEETASIEGAIVFIIAFIVIMGRIFTYERLPDAIAASMLSLTENRIILLLLINVFMIIMGMIMDDLSAMLLAAPLLFPLFMKLGIHPFQMAAIMAVNQGSGQMTPPVATNLFTAARVSGLPVSSFVRDCVPFLLFGSLPVLLLVTFVPELSLFLPELIMGK